MKKNSFTIVCAVLTLGVCMLLGAIFGASDIANRVAENAASHPIEADARAVVNK